MLLARSREHHEGTLESFVFDSIAERAAQGVYM